MLITSSRKPSINTRVLCKYLAYFFQCECINRGKMGMKETLSLVEGGPGPLLIIGEYHGNPGSLLFYAPDGRELLSIRISVNIISNIPKKRPVSEAPAATGTAEIAPILAKMLAIDMVDKPASSRVLEISNDCLSFLYDGQYLLKLNIKSIR
jgi:U3 small nucleolar ribonucleoprotein protein IMP4